jgi:spermidine synthase
MGKKKNYWLTEYFTPYERHSHCIRKTYVSKRTKFQNLELVESYEFGKCLILDKEMQSAELDEFIYHEALVHPALLLHPNPKKVLILGGGEGATAREILKHRSVEQIIMIDIDEEVIKFAKKYLYKWHKGAFDNKKVKLIISDAKKYVEETQETFDVIISDLSSPIRGSPSCLLYTKEFYEVLRTKLSIQNGIFVLQAGSAGLLQIQLHLRLYATLGQVFPVVRPYYEYVPSFDTPWAFILCSFDRDPLEKSVKEVDSEIEKRVKGKLLFYDGITHQRLFNLPKYIREMLSKEKRIITREKMCYFYK